MTIAIVYFRKTIAIVNWRRNTMKRIGSGILALFLCLFFGVTALAAKDEHVALPDDAGEVRSLAAWEDTLYLLTVSAVYSC